MLIDNFGIISQVEWHVKTRQNQGIFEAKYCQNMKMAKNNASVNSSCDHPPPRDNPRALVNFHFFRANARG